MFIEFTDFQSVVHLLSYLSLRICILVLHSKTMVICI